MKKTAKKLWKFVLKTFLGFLAFIILYVTITFVLSQIEINSEDLDTAKDVTIYIKSNGVHTDIVVPVKNKIKDWTADIPFSQTRTQDSTAQFVGIGWGNKDFYLNTPNWSDMKVSTALKAAFHMGTTAMHIEFYESISENERCKKIEMSFAEYQKLVNYLSDSFYKNERQQTQWIPNRGYNDNDAFYDANRKYNLFYTCNSWANNALKASDQKSALWTLTTSGILCHYD